MNQVQDFWFVDLELCPSQQFLSPGSSVLLGFREARTWNLKLQFSNIIVYTTTWNHCHDSLESDEIICVSLPVGVWFVRSLPANEGGMIL